MKKTENIPEITVIVANINLSLPENVVRLLRKVRVPDIILDMRKAVLKSQIQLIQKVMSPVNPIPNLMFRGLGLGLGIRQSLTQIPL